VLDTLAPPDRLAVAGHDVFAVHVDDRGNERPNVDSDSQAR
jgi:hypothetical protein